MVVFFCGFCVKFDVAVAERAVQQSVIKCYIGKLKEPNRFLFAKKKRVGKLREGKRKG